MQKLWFSACPEASLTEEFSAQMGLKGEVDRVEGWDDEDDEQQSS